MRTLLASHQSIGMGSVPLVTLCGTYKNPLSVLYTHPIPGLAPPFSPTPGSELTCVDVVVAEGFEPLGLGVLGLELLPTVGLGLLVFRPV